MSSARNAVIVAFVTSVSSIPTVALAQAAPADTVNTPTATPVAAAAAAAAQQAAAQPADNGLGQIVVTARRRAENLQDVPLAVTAYTPKQLQEKAITDRTSLADNTPSLFTINGGYPREFAFFALRGQGPAFGSTPGVINYFAEVPNSLNIDGRVGSYYDLASIQVLAGPQGTLFGKNATGGNILFEPAKPRNDFDGYVQGELGNYHDKRLQGALNFQIVPDKVLLRVAGEIGRRDGYTIDVGPNFPGKDYDNQHYQSVRAGLTIRPADGVEFYTVARYYYSNNNGGGTVLDALNPATEAEEALFYPGLATYLATQQARGPRRVSYDLNQFSKTTYWQVINQASIDLTPQIKLKNIISLSQLRTYYGYDYDATPYPLAGQTGTVPTTSPNYFTEELQLQGKALNDALDFAFGGYLDHQGARTDTGISAYTSFPIGTLIPPIGAIIYSTNRSHAVFGQATLNLGKLAPALTGLSLTGGLRYTWEHSFSYSQIVAPPAVTGTADSHYPSYTATLDYNFSKGLHAYVTARDAYKSGGVNGPVPADSPYRTFLPEKLSDVEVGLKSEFSLGTVLVRANMDAYRGIYQNIQRTSAELVNGIFLNVTHSAAKGRIQGLEFNGSILPFRGLTLNGSFSYIDGKYTKVTDTSSEAILAGSPFPYTPKYKYSLGAVYEVPLEGTGDLSFSVNYVHQTKVSTAQTNQTYYQYLPGYGLLNGNIDLRNIAERPLDVGLFVNNLTNKTVPVGVLDQYYGGPGFVGLTYNEPRMYGIRATYHFGR